MNESEQFYHYFISRLNNLALKKEYCMRYYYNEYLNTYEIVFHHYSNFDSVSKFINIIKKSELKKLDIETGNYEIRVIANKAKEYLKINFINNKITTIIKKSDNNVIKIYSDKCFQNLNLVFYSKNNIYVNTNNNKFFKLNLKTLDFFNYDIGNIFINYFSQFNKIWKDIAYTSYGVPIPMELIWNSHNIRELLMFYFKIKDMPKSVNRKNFRVLCSVCCCLPYVEEKQQILLYNFPKAVMNIYPESGRNWRKETAKKYLYYFIKSRLVLLKESDDNILMDYIRMSIDAKVKISLLDGMKKIRKKHNEISLLSYEKKYKHKKISIPDTPLSRLKLPKEFVRITKSKDLFKESIRNSNCVHSYIDKINNGKCLIYTADLNNEHCTIEITYSRGKYRLSQIYTKYNNEVKEETLKYVKNVINECNKNIKNEN